MAIILQWSNAFDEENNISGYELSYKTNGPSWIELPFIQSTQSSGSYSFPIIQQIDHTFRIIIRDENGSVSQPQYFTYPVAPSYQISNLNSSGNACGILLNPNVTYSIIGLNSTPPAIGDFIYNSDGTRFVGLNKYWIIKSPSGLNYSCKIHGNSNLAVGDNGKILEITLCGNNSGFRSIRGTNVLNNTCNLNPTVNIYWPGTASFVVGTLLYTNIDCTSIFNGTDLFYLIQYTDANELISTKIVKVGGTGTNLGKIISVNNKTDVCRVIRAGGISALSNTPHTATCSSTSPHTCYIISVDNIDIAVNDIVYTDVNATTKFIGASRTYRVFIQATTPVIKLCKIDDDGKVTQTSYCSSSGRPGTRGGGGDAVSNEINRESSSGSEPRRRF